MEALKMISYYDGQLIDIMPGNITKKPEVKALSYALQQACRILFQYSQRLYLYDNLDEQPEEVIDLLASELRTQFYQSTLSLDVKRQLVKNTLIWYTTAGTPQAVEEFVNVLYGTVGKITEWFEYGGSPGYFRIYVKNLEDINPQKHKNFEKTLYKVKRLSAHLDVIVYIFEYWIKYLIKYENCLTMISDFYPRYNLPYLMYDGTAPYGRYKYNGYKTDSFVDLYPTKLSYHIPRLFVYDHIPKMGLHDKAKQQIKNKETKIFYLLETNSKVGIENRLKIKTAHKGSVPTYQVSLTIGKHLTQYNGKYQYNGTRKYDSQIIHEVL